MQSTTSLTLNLQLPNCAVTMYAVQNDRKTRMVQATLFDGDTAWTPPVGAVGMVRFVKSDGTQGFYEVDEDGNTAVTWVGNVATIRLAEQALTVAGDVYCQVNFYNASEERLSTFSWLMKVQKCVVTDDTIISTDYFNILSQEIAEILEIYADLPTPSTSNPLMDGTASAGSTSTYSRSDHRHPTDTSRAPTNHASTATTYGAASTSNYGHVKLSNTTPIMDGTAAVGDRTDVARANHVHPSDTSRVPTTRKINGMDLSQDRTLTSENIGYNSSTTYSSGTVGKAVSELNGAINDISTTTNTLFTLDGLQIGKSAAGATASTRAISADIYCENGIVVKAEQLPLNLKYEIEYYSSSNISDFVGAVSTGWITDNNTYSSPSSVTQKHFRILFGSVDNNALTASDFNGLVLQVNNGSTLEITAKDKDARLTANEAKNTADCAENALENWGDALVTLTWHYNTTTVPANDGVTVMPNNSSEKLSRWYFIGINNIVTGSKKLLIRGVTGYSGELNLVNISNTDIDFEGSMQVRFFDPLILQNFFA